MTHSFAHCEVVSLPSKPPTAPPMSHPVVSPSKNAETASFIRASSHSNPSSPTDTDTPLSRNHASTSTPARFSANGAFTRALSYTSTTFGRARVVNASATTTRPRPRARAVFVTCSSPRPRTSPVSIGNASRTIAHVDGSAADSSSSHHSVGRGARDVVSTLALHRAITSSLFVSIVIHRSMAVCSVGQA